MAEELLVQVARYTEVGQNARKREEVFIGKPISHLRPTIGKKVDGVPTQLYDVIDLAGRKIVTTDQAGFNAINSKITLVELKKYFLAGRQARLAGKDYYKQPAAAEVNKVTKVRRLVNGVQTDLYSVNAFAGKISLVTDQAGFDAINLPA